MLIRKVEINDSDDILKWRNDPQTYSMFITKKKVSLNEHKEWLKNSLKNPNIKLYIGYIENNKIGICRFNFDEKSNSTEVSITLNPLMRKKKLSFELLSESINIFKKTNKSILKATVKKENYPSIKIFEKNGFVEINSNNEFLFYSC